MTAGLPISTKQEIDSLLYSHPNWQKNKKYSFLFRAHYQCKNCLTPAVDRHSAVIGIFRITNCSFEKAEQERKDNDLVSRHLVWNSRQQKKKKKKFVPLAKTFHGRQFHMCRKTTFGNQCHQHTTESFYDVKFNNSHAILNFHFSIKTRKKKMIFL